MKITIQDEKLSFIQEIVKEVVSTFINSLNNKVLLKAKLSTLELKIFKTVNESTFGMMSSDGEEHIIAIYVSFSDSHKKIAFIIAHELAHLLFVNVIDPLKISGMASDRSAMSTAIKRIDEEGNVYGQTLEELLADYLAFFISKKLNLSDDNNSFAKMIENKSTRIKFVEKFSSFFGDSLLEKIDEVKEIMFDSEKCLEPSNILWYSIVTFNFSLIINMYDNIIGANAFKYFNEKLDEYLKDYSANKEKMDEEFEKIILNFECELN